jgi:hypothetical protein
MAQLVVDMAQSAGQLYAFSPVPQVPLPHRVQRELPSLGQPRISPSPQFCTIVKPWQHTGPLIFFISPSAVQFSNVPQSAGQLVAVSPKRQMSLPQVSWGFIDLRIIT